MHECGGCVMSRKTNFRKYLTFKSNGHSPNKIVIIYDPNSSTRLKNIET